MTRYKLERLQDCGSYWGDPDEDGIPGYFISEKDLAKVVEAINTSIASLDNVPDILFDAHDILVEPEEKESKPMREDGA